MLPRWLLGKARPLSSILQIRADDDTSSLERDDRLIIHEVDGVSGIQQPRSATSREVFQFDWRHVTTMDPYRRAPGAAYNNSRWDNLPRAAPR